MAGNFSFPPPPPPPTKAVPEARQDHEYGVTDQGGRGRGRGRGRGGRGAIDRRGRGGPSQHRWTNRGGHYGQYAGNQYDQSHQSQSGYQQPQDYARGQPLPPGSYVNPNFRQVNGDLDGPRPPQPGHPQKPIGPPRTFAGHKRKLDALRPPSREQNQPKRPAAPAVPSFGPPILPSKPVHVLPPGNEPKATASANGLGLTPGGEERHYSSDDDDGEDKDVDEEAMFAELGGKLTFEHNGVVMSLSSAADLAAWKEERRKNWPTRMRMSEKEMQKRQTGEERKRLLAGMLGLQSASASKAEDSRCDARKANILARPQADDERSKPVESKLEKARKELAQQSKKLEALRQRVLDSQATLDKAQAESEERDRQALVGHAVGEDEPGHEDDRSDASSVFSESSVVSSDSSGSEDPDDDGPPEEATAKVPAMPVTTSERPVCKFYYASGHCRDGDHCRFRHELGPGVKKASQLQKHAQRDPHAPKLDRVERERKSIYERLMEQQEEEEDRLALKVIKYLGRSGFFGVDIQVGETSSTT